MNYCRLAKLTILGTALGLAGFACQVTAAQDDAKEDQQSAQQATVEQQSADKQAAAALPVYRPPLRGAPAARVGGGTRGPGDSSPYIAVITPPHTALTSAAQPTLFWYLSGNMSGDFEIALINDRDIEPTLDLSLTETLSPGIHSIRLADLGITLEPGVSYQWSVAAVRDAANRSSDILSSGRIRYVEIDQQLAARLQGATAEQAVNLYAEAGYWYDAYAQLSELLTSKPDDANLLRQRSALLRQAELPVVASFSE